MKSLFKLDFVTRVILGVYVIYSIIFLIREPILLGADYLVSWMLGLISIILLFRIVLLLTSFSSNLKFLSLFGLSLLYALGMAYKYRTGSSFDFALFIDNVNEMVYFESTAVVFEVFNSLDILFLLVFSLGLLLIQILKKKLSQADGGPFPSIQLPIGLLFYGAIVAGPVPADDVMTGLFQGAVGHYRFSGQKELSHKYDQLDKSDRYPFFNVVTKKGPKVRPNVILIALESFNANFVEKTTSDGREITPFFNSLIKQGYYLENFYSGSIQTGKGHFSILCSLLPLSQGKAFVRYADHHFYCLPQILKDFGYSTIFFQGNKRVDFDNSYTFLSRNGIDQFVTPDLTIYSKKLLEEIKWGWGLQDNYLYQQALARMDLMLEKNLPVFMMVAPISNHMRFNHVPKSQRILYSDDRGDPKKQYLNSLRLADEYLKSFFYELKKRPYYKDSLVIVTSDHSFPVGEHGNYFPETHAYQESFGVPLLILWPRKLPVLRETERAFSQIDIAPTILDILGIEVSNHFLGQSILQTEKKRMQYLVQPYDGLYRVIIDYPYKYLFHQRSAREQLFDLSSDPAEVRNLREDQSHKQILIKMRQELSLFVLNDQLMRENRVYPRH